MSAAPWINFIDKSNVKPEAEGDGDSITKSQTNNVRKARLNGDTHKE